MSWDLKLCLLFVVNNIALCEQSNAENGNANITLTTCKEVEENRACRLSCKTPDLNANIAFENPNHQAGQLSCLFEVSFGTDCNTTLSGYSLHQNTNTSLTHLDIANVRHVVDGINWTCKYKALVSNVETINIIKVTTTTASSTGSTTAMETTRPPARAFQTVYIIAPIAAAIVLVSTIALIMKYRNTIVESICKRRYQRAEPEDPLEQGIVNNNKV